VLEQRGLGTPSTGNRRSTAANDAELHSALSVAAQQSGSKPRRLRGLGDSARPRVYKNQIKDVEELRQCV